MINPKYASLCDPTQIRNLESEDDAALSKNVTHVSAASRQDWLARTYEIVEKYHADLLCFNWWVGQPSFRETERRFAAFYYDYAAQHQQCLVMNYKLNSMHESAGVLDVKRGQLPASARCHGRRTRRSATRACYIDDDTYKQPTP